MITREKPIRSIDSFLKRKKAKGYVVGGFLRDMILGRPSFDMDIVLAGVRPKDLAGYLHRSQGFSRPAFFPRFGTTLTVGDGFKIQICPLEGDIESDAGRRDLTLNCLYAETGKVRPSMSRCDILDPTGRGISDLKAGILRTPAEPCFSLWLDPVRILRVVRFHALLGFTVDRQLRQAMERMVYLLARMPGERIMVELEKILVSSRLRSSFRLLQSTRVTDIVMPELGRTHGYSQSTPYHAYDLLTHSIKTAAATPPDLVLRLAGLLHDVGKIHTRAARGDRTVYYGHEKVSAEIAKSILMRLRFPKRVAAEVVFLISNHMINYSRTWSDRAIRRFVRRMGDRLDRMLLLVQADRRAQRPEPDMGDDIVHLRRRIKALYRDDLLHLELPVDGYDIMTVLGIEEGELVGRAKEFLSEEATKRRKAMTRRECVRLLREWASREQNA